MGLLIEHASYKESVFKRKSFHNFAAVRRKTGFNKTAILP